MAPACGALSSGVRWQVDVVAHRKSVFAWFGTAAYHAQCFEMELRSTALLWFRLMQPAASPDQVDGEDGRLVRKTMGQLLKELESAGLITTGASKELNLVLKKRNYLMHGFYFKNAACFKTSASRDAVIAELQSLSDEFKIADDATSELTKRLQRKLGWSDEMIERLLEQELLRAEDAT